MKFFDLLKLLCVSLVITGCAVGNRYDYRAANLPMSAKGSGAVGVSVAEARPYVVNGEKSANFVGLQRGGFGNPFDVTTESGRPLADDMRESLERSLTARGFRVIPLDPAQAAAGSIATTAEKAGLSRVAVLDVRDWKSDAMMRLTMHHDLALRIYDAQGTLLAESRSARTDAIGSASFQSANATAVRGEFERVVGGLFEDPAVKKALEEAN